MYGICPGRAWGKVPEHPAGFCGRRVAKRPTGGESFTEAAFALKPMLASAKPRRQGCKVLVGSGEQARKEGDRELPEPVTLILLPY